MHLWNPLDKEAYPREPVSGYGKWAPRNWPVRLYWQRLSTANGSGNAEAACRKRGHARPMVSERRGAVVAVLAGFSATVASMSTSHARYVRTSRGSFDLHGNICEWTHDWHWRLQWRRWRRDSPGAASSWPIPRGSRQRGDTAMRSITVRRDASGSFPTGTIPSIGFRLALTISAATGLCSCSSTGTSTIVGPDMEHGHFSLGKMLEFTKSRPIKDAVMNSPIVYETVASTLGFDLQEQSPGSRRSRRPFCDGRRKSDFSNGGKW